MVLQLILGFIFYNHLGFELLLYVGWIIFVVSIVLVLLSVFTLRNKGGGGWDTTVLVDSGVYAVVRHPWYLGCILVMSALILISQHWLSVILGVTTMPLIYIDALKEDKSLIQKFGDDYKRHMQKVPRMNFGVGVIRLLRRRKRE